MAERPPAKRSRAELVAARAGVSDAALSRVLAALAAEPDGPQATSRQSLARRAEQFLQAATPYGPVLTELELPLTAGGHWQWAVPNPFALLWLMCSSCASLAEAFRKAAVGRDPTEPWRLVFYSDEATPGNLLRLDNSRKSHIFYFSFADFDHDLLSREHLWFVGGLIRSKIASKIRGGLSCIFRTLLALFFGAVHNFETTGVTLPVGPSEPPLQLLARMSCCVADEAALKALWCFKGASGQCPCMLCRNVVEPRGNLPSFDASGYIVDLRCHEPSRFDTHTDSTIWEAVDLLAHRAQRGSRAEVRATEQALGLAHAPCGLLLDQGLRQHIRPASCVMYDWMHVFLVHGAFQTEVHLLLDKLKGIGLGFKELHAYASTWNWPSWVRCSPKAVFNERREAACSSADTFKCAASEALSIYPVMLHLFNAVVDAEALAPQRRSFAALCAVLDALQLVKSRGTAADQLERRAVRHFILFKEAYPDEVPKPKHHFALHMGQLHRRHNTLYACFVHERRHRSLKVHAGRVTNLSGFEKSVLIDLITTHVAMLDEKHATVSGCVLLHETSASPALQQLIGEMLRAQADELRWSPSAAINGARVSRGDVVRKGNSCASVRGFVRSGTAALALVSPWRPIDHTTTWEIGEGVALLRLEDVGAPCAWAIAEGRRAYVLPPPA